MPELIVEPVATAASAGEDQARSQQLLERIARGELDRALRAWTPRPALALSRLDELRPGADEARAIAERLGYEPVRRVSGGHAVVLGAGSFCIGFGEPAHTFEGTQERYERFTAALIDALAQLGIAAEQGELDGEWCPGAWSIRSDGVKLAGLAQRAVKGAAWAEAVVELSADASARGALEAIYGALELPLDPATLGSVSEIAARPVGFDELATPLIRALSS